MSCSLEVIFGNKLKCNISAAGDISLCYYNRVYFYIIIMMFCYYFHPLSLLHSSSLKSTCLTDQALYMLCCCNNLLTARQLLSITALCIRIYTAGRRLSGFKLCVICFKIIPVMVSRMVLYRAFPVALFLLTLVSSLYTSGASQCWYCDCCDCWKLLRLLSLLLWWFCQV